MRDAEVSLTRNLVSVELRGNELRDAPLQKNGALRGKRVTFDLRKGTPLADVSGAVAGLRRSLDERLAPGGSITLDSDNRLDVAPGATLDVSGGVVTYSGGVLDTTKLISGGRLFDISQADPGRVYDGIFGAAQTVHRKWNVTENYRLFSDARANFEAGYREGKDAGTLTLAAPVLNMRGAAKGGITIDAFQRNKPERPRRLSTRLRSAAARRSPDAWARQHRVRREAPPRITCSTTCGSTRARWRAPPPWPMAMATC
jgi:filamentous hemagglutinin